MTSEPTNEQVADVARLADGTLPEARRAEVEAQVAASPELARMLESQTVTLNALAAAAAETGAPARLRADVERRREPRRRTRVAPVRAVLAVAAAAVLAAVLVLPGALSGGLTVSDAAAFGAKTPAQPAPRDVPGTPQLLQAQVDNVPFPNYAAKFGWQPIGVRHDRSDDRNATTVYYRKANRLVSYTIVGGDALDRPSDAQKTKRGGVEYRIFRHDGRTVVTWERSGRTCVLSSTTVGPAELLALADWRGKGAIPF